MGRPRTAVLLALAALMLAASIVGAAVGAKGGVEPTTVLVSTGEDGKGGDGNSLEPATSGDGRFVAFAPRAKTLTPAAKNGKRQIFVKDIQTGAVTLVSRADGAAGAVGDGNSYDPSI